ncbi:MAG: hypothetical protein U0X91_23430 [Spirosomataceae bacterium]
MKKLILFFALVSSSGFAQSVTIDPTSVRVPGLSVVPSCGANDRGKLYFNNNDNKMYYCNGSAWVDFSGGGLTLPYSGTVNIGTPIFNLTNTVESGRGVYVKTGTGGQEISAENYAGYFNGAQNGIYATSGVGKPALRTAGSLQFRKINEGAGRTLTSDATGNATWQSNGAFFVTRNADVSINSAVATKLTFNTKSVDPDNNFNTALSRFIAPQDGLYHFDVTIDWTATFTATKVYVQIVNLNTIDEVKRVATQVIQVSAEKPTLSCSATFHVLGSESVEVRVFQNSGSAKSIESSASTYFSGYMVRPL